MKRAVLLGIALCVLLCGCHHPPDEATPHAMWHSDPDGVCVGGQIYVAAPLRFYTGDGGEGVSVCQDPLCSHTTTDCIAVCGENAVFVVDGAENAVYLADTGRIWRIDMAQQTKTTVLAGVPNRVTQLFSYGDALYYTTLDGDVAQGVYIISKDGDFRGALRDPTRRPTLLTVTDDHIYYVNQYGELFENDLTLSAERLLDSYDGMAADERFSVFAVDDRLYFPDAKSQCQQCDGTMGYSVYCRYMNLSDGTFRSAAHTTEQALLGLFDGVVYYAPMKMVGMEQNDTFVITNKAEWALMGLPVDGSRRIQVMPRGGWQVVKLYDVTAQHVLFLGVPDDGLCATVEGQTPSLCCYDRETGAIELVDTPGWTPPVR